MLQQNDMDLITVLNNLATDKLTDVDLLVINSRSIGGKNVSRKAISLFGKIKSVDKYNTNRINNHPGITYIFKAIDSVANIISEKTKFFLLKSFEKKKRQQFGG